MNDHSNLYTAQMTLKKRWEAGIQVCGVHVESCAREECSCRVCSLVKSKTTVRKKCKCHGSSTGGCRCHHCLKIEQVGGEENLCKNEVIVFCIEEIRIKIKDTHCVSAYSVDDLGLKGKKADLIVFITPKDNRNDYPIIIVIEAKKRKGKTKAIDQLEETMNWIIGEWEKSDTEITKNHLERHMLGIIAIGSKKIDEDRLERRRKSIDKNKPTIIDHPYPATKLEAVYNNDDYKKICPCENTDPPGRKIKEHFWNTLYDRTLGVGQRK